jgi:hypothetical protein
MLRTKSRREILDEMGEAIANAHNPTPKGAPFYNALLTIVPQARLFFARINAGHCVFEVWVEVGSEGSVEQRYGPMNKNWTRGLRRQTSRHLKTKSVSIKDAGGKSGGRVSKAVELISGRSTHESEEGPTLSVSSRTRTHGMALRQPISLGLSFAGSEDGEAGNGNLRSGEAPCGERRIDPPARKGSILRNRPVRTRMPGGVAGVSGRPLPLCRFLCIGLFQSYFAGERRAESG